MRRTLATLSLLFGFAFQAALPAQASPPPDNAAVIAATVTHMLDMLRANDGVPAQGTIRYDARVLRSRVLEATVHRGPATVYELDGERGQEFAATLRSLMRAEPGDMDRARVCTTESLRSCTIRDGAAIFATSDPVLHGDTAEIIVKAMWLSDLMKQPVQDGVFRVTLRRGPSGWEAVSTHTLFIS